MATLNPYAPLFIPAREAPPADAGPFFSPLFCAYGYSDALAQPTFLFPSDPLSADVLFTPALVPAPVQQPPQWCYCYFFYQHEAGVNSGSPFPWSTQTAIGVAVPPLAPTELSVPFHPAHRFMQEYDLMAPPPAWQWHPPIHPAAGQPEILEMPPLPLPKTQVRGGKPPSRAVILRKKVKVGPRWRLTVANMNAATGVVAGGAPPRCPRRRGHAGMKTSWMPRLRCYRKKSPAEVKLYERFQFKTGGGSSSGLAGDGGGDARTTVMIKNVPNKLTKETLLVLLDQHCQAENSILAATCGQLQEGDCQFIPSQFDFFYLPMDFGTGSNLGYAFVNFTSAAAAWRLHRHFDKQTWALFGSKKVCEVTYARIQGLRALIKHFRNTTFLCDREELLPICFVPYRDGTFWGEIHYVGRRVSTLHSWRHG